MSPALPKNWHYVYLLSNNKTSYIYIGCTNNLERRIHQHSEGRVYTTKKVLPVELIYYEAYRSKECAYNREKSLKYFGSGLSKLKSRLGINKKGRAG